MVKFYPSFFSPLGTTGDTSVYIKDSSNVWQEFINYEYFKVVKKQNQVSEFEIKIMDLEAAEKLYVKEFAEIMFFSETNLILKGRIQKIKYETAYESFVQGFGMEAKLLEKELIKNGDKRVQYTNDSAQTIANEVLSSNTDGATPWIITPSTDGLFSTDYGTVSIRYEYGNRLSSIAKLVDAIDYEWRVTQDGNRDDFFEVAPLLPDATSATVSQETFEITGADANCSQTSNERDVTNLANKIDALGYGDGVNQKHTSTYNASETYSTLASDITDASTTVSLADASSFASSGEIRIAEERVTYSGKSGNDLTGCGRGASSTTALAHKKNIYIEKYVAITSAESGSSIGANGLMDYTVTERDILDLQTLELIASRKLLERMNPIVRIIVIPNEPLETAGAREIGDLITVNDSESDLSDDYRIVSMKYVSDYGDLSLEIEVSNKSLSFIEQMQKQREANENLQKYMQGSTNIYAISESENCDASHYLNLRFFIPNEAVAINSVKLNFKLEDYRAYSSANANESTHTHGMPSLVVNGTTTQTSTSGSRTPTSTSGVSVWAALTIWYAHTNSKSLTNVNENIVGGPDYYTTRANILLINTTGSSQSVTPKTELPSGTILTHAISYSLANNSYGGWESGETSSGNESGWAKFWDDNYNCSGCSGTITNIYDHNHGSHTHSLPALTVDASTTVSNTSDAGSAHTHGITYGISETSLTSPSVNLYTGEDGGSMTLKDTYTTTQTEIDLTTEASDVGAGKWVNLQFRPNKNMRIEANAYIQIFIESK